jgi:hypothetical protein
MCYRIFKIDVACKTLANIFLSPFSQSVQELLELDSDTNLNFDHTDKYEDSN